MDATQEEVDAAIVSETIEKAFVGGYDHIWTLSGDDYANLPEGIITGERFAIETVFKMPAAANSWLWSLGTKMGTSPNVTNYITTTLRRL